MQDTDNPWTASHHFMAKSDPQDTRSVRSKSGKKWGDSTIEVTVRFWTDGISKHKRSVIQKNAWDFGAVYMKKNRLHFIRPSRPKPFNSLLDLSSAIAKVLEEQGVVIHPGPKLQKILKV